jgi:hypothetical protein
MQKKILFDALRAEVGLLDNYFNEHILVNIGNNEVTKRVNA